jgi:hypothetical protein
MKISPKYGTLKANYSYISLENTLDMLDRQISISVPFAEDFTDSVANNPYSLFRYLKSLVIYKDDPPGVELIQSMPSLFLDNYYGVPGMGDCDCFSVTACASMIAKGIPTGYTIYGNDKWPTHIAADAYDGSGRTIFDLCAPELGMVRDYKWQKSFRLT